MDGWMDDGQRTGVGGRKSDVDDPQVTQITRISRKGTEAGGLRFRKTGDIIEAAERGLLPDKVMLNVHPQRWDDRPLPWVRPGETLLRRMLSACFTG